MMMRFELVIGYVCLMGAALAAPIGETFQDNRDAILSKATTIVGETVFSVGRARSSRKVGDDIGFSKAALFAYGNLDRLNFERADWPESVKPEERGAVWKAYRAANPFALTVGGGQRIYQEKPQAEHFLLVMAFPRNRVVLPRVTQSELLPFVNAYRQGRKALERELSRDEGGDDMPNSPLNVETNSFETEAWNPIRGAQITPGVPSPTNKITENFDEALML